MAKDLDRLKRRLLRDLVRENVDLIEGRLPRLHKRRRLPAVLRALILAGVSAGLLGSTRLLPTLDEPLASPSVSSVAMASAAAASVPPAALASPPTTSVLGAPTPVDAAVFPLAVRKIALDAGHGGASFGTRAPKGLMEKELTLDIAQRLQRLLAADSFQVLMTRDDDRSLSLEERGRAANRAGADIFVSIHLNWIENRQARGIETYYLGPTDDPYLTRLAAAENRESGYSMTDMRRLLDGIYAGVRQDKSHRLAEVVQTALFHSLGKVNPGLENRGVKAAPFIVLLTTEMPAILAEVSCLSNTDEAELLTKPLYRQYIAEALAAGIRSYARSYADAADAADTAADKQPGPPGKKGT